MPKTLGQYTSQPAADVIRDPYVRKAILSLLGTASGVEQYDTFADFPSTGDDGVIYVDSANSALYIWDGTDYVQSSGGGGGTFASITGDPADNSALVTYIADHSTGSTQLVYLSAHGVPNDAVLDLDSATFGTDAHAAVTAVLDGLSNATVIWDVKCSLSDEIVIPNGVKIQAMPGCGAIMRNASNKAMFVNANPTFDPNARDDHDIEIQGGIWNGNAAGQTIVGSGSYGQVSVFRFYGVTNLTISDFTIYNQKCYAVDVINCARYHASHFTIDAGLDGATFNDGIHANFCDDVVIRDGYIRCNDDAVALNTDDQYNNPAGDTYPYYLDAGGPSKNIWIENIVLNSNAYGIRLLSGGSRMDSIVIKGITGTTNAYAVIIDNFQAFPDRLIEPGAGNIGMVTLEDVNVKILSTNSVTNSAMININCNVESIVIRNGKRNNFDVASPFILVAGANTLVRSLVLDGYNSYDSVTNSNASVIIVDAATVNNITTNNIKIDRVTTSATSAVLKLTSAAKVDIWQANGLNCNAVQYLLWNLSGFIKAVVATNIIHFNTTASEASFKTATLIPRIIVSNYLGNTILSGTFTTQTGDAFAVGATGGAAISYSTAATPPAYVGSESVGTDLTFTNKDTGVTNTSQIFTTSSGNNSWTGNGAYDSSSLAATTAGGVIQFAHQLLGPSVGSGVVGFLTSATIPTDQTSFYAGFNLGGSDKITIWQNGAGALSSYSWKLGRWYRMYVDAAGGFSVQESSDGTTWNVVIPFSGLAAYTGQKWPGMVLYGNSASNSVRYPKRTW